MQIISIISLHRKHSKQIVDIEERRCCLWDDEEPLELQLNSVRYAVDSWAGSSGER